MFSLPPIWPSFGHKNAKTKKRYILRVPEKRESGIHILWVDGWWYDFSRTEKTQFFCYFLSLLILRLGHHWVHSKSKIENKNCRPLISLHSMWRFHSVSLAWLPSDNIRPQTFVVALWWCPHLRSARYVHWRRVFEKWGTHSGKDWLFSTHTRKEVFTGIGVGEENWEKGMPNVWRRPYSLQAGQLHPTCCGSCGNFQWGRRWIAGRQLRSSQCAYATARLSDIQAVHANVWVLIVSADDKPRWSIPDVPFLLHLENGGAPHCVAVCKVSEKRNQVAVVDVDGIFELSMTDFQESFMKGIDASTAVFFLLEENKAEEADQSLDKLLELSAAADAEDELLEVLSDATMQWSWCSGWPVPRGRKGFKSTDRTGVAGSWWQIVCGWVALAVFGWGDQKTFAHQRPPDKADATTIRCPACPFRMFKRRDQLRTHMQRHHTQKQQFCCSGTKQLRIVLALHDADQLLGKTKQTNYLQRSAVLLRASVKPNLSRSRNSIDRNIRLLLDSKGPRFVHADYLKAGVSARRVGRLWYTRTFGEQVWQELLLHHGKARWG